MRATKELSTRFLNRRWATATLALLCRMLPPNSSSLLRRLATGSGGSMAPAAAHSSPPPRQKFTQPDAQGNRRRRWRRRRRRRRRRRARNRFICSLDFPGASYTQKRHGTEAMQAPLLGGSRLKSRRLGVLSRAARGSFRRRSPEASYCGSVRTPSGLLLAPPPAVVHENAEEELRKGGSGERIQRLRGLLTQNRTTFHEPGRIRSQSNWWNWFKKYKKIKGWLRGQIQNLTNLRLFRWSLKILWGYFDLRLTKRLTLVKL